MLAKDLSEVYLFIESLTLSDIFVFYSIAYMGVMLVRIVADIEINLTEFKFSEKLLATVVILHLLFTLSYTVQANTLFDSEFGSKAVAILILLLILKLFEITKKHLLNQYFDSRLQKEANRLLHQFEEKRRAPQKVDEKELKELSSQKTSQYTPVIKEFALFLYITIASTNTVLDSDLNSGAAVAVLSIVFMFLVYKQTKQVVAKAEGLSVVHLIKQA